MKSVYIILTRTSTAFSRLIHLATAADYTHVSVAVDPELRTFYSFGRRKPGRPFPAGFVLEGPERGYFGRNPGTKCCLYELKVADTAYDKILERLGQMEGEAARYKYSVLGILFCMLELDVRRCRHYFCSQFVGAVLQESGALTLPKPASLMRPNDYRGIPQLIRRYSGNIAGLRRLRGRAAAYATHEMREERNAI